MFGLSSHDYYDKLRNDSREQLNTDASESLAKFCGINILYIGIFYMSSNFRPRPTVAKNRAGDWA
jgi:hypothetical protein